MSKVREVKLKRLKYIVEKNELAMLEEFFAIEKAHGHSAEFINERFGAEDSKHPLIFYAALTGNFYLCEALLEKGAKYSALNPDEIAAIRGSLINKLADLSLPQRGESSENKKERELKIEGIECILEVAYYWPYSERVFASIMAAIKSSTFEDQYEAESYAAAQIAVMNKLLKDFSTKITSEINVEVSEAIRAKMAFLSARGSSAAIDEVDDHSSDALFSKGGAEIDRMLVHIVDQSTESFSHLDQSSGLNAFANDSDAQADVATSRPDTPQDYDDYEDDEFYSDNEATEGSSESVKSVALGEAITREPSQQSIFSKRLRDKVSAVAASMERRDEGEGSAREEVRSEAAPQRSVFSSELREKVKKATSLMAQTENGAGIAARAMPSRLPPKTSTKTRSSGRI